MKMAEKKNSFVLFFHGFQTEKKEAAGSAVVTEQNSIVSLASGKFQIWTVILPVAGMLLLAACASLPETTGQQYTPWHYSYSVLYAPDAPEFSPRLELAMSLIEMKYPTDEAHFFNSILYSTATLDEYKDKIISEQRKRYRSAEYIPVEKILTGEEAGKETVEDETVPAAVTETAGIDGNGELLADNAAEEEQIILEYPLNANWRYMETVTAKNIDYRGIIVERVYDIYTGGANNFHSKQYYVLDMETQKPVRIDDLFNDYQGDETRAVIYDELRKYASLAEGESLSAGMFLSDEPELTFNFFLTEQGIGLYWNAYEIAPGSAGDVEIIIPWQKVRPLLLPSGMELLTKFNIFLFV